MERSQIRRLALKQKDFEIELEKGGGETVVYSPPAPAVAPSPQQMPPSSSPPAGGDVIPSPMVGTFYATSSPEEPPFVKVGDQVDEETVVCILEAMKVMNEVKAGVRGTITEVLLKSGDPVEFGTSIFRIRLT